MALCNKAVAGPQVLHRNRRFSSVIMLHHAQQCSIPSVALSVPRCMYHIKTVAKCDTQHLQTNMCNLYVGTKGRNSSSSKTAAARAVAAAAEQQRQHEQQGNPYLVGEEGWLALPCAWAPPASEDRPDGCASEKEDWAPPVAGCTACGCSAPSTCRPDSRTQPAYARFVSRLEAPELRLMDRRKGFCCRRLK